MHIGNALACLQIRIGHVIQYSLLLPFCNRQSKDSRSRREDRAAMLSVRASSSPSASTSGAGEPQQPGSLAGSAAPPSVERRENFLTRVMKPLQDFGFGKMSFMEGGVGLFVFAGVGALQPGHFKCASSPKKRHSLGCEAHRSLAVSNCGVMLACGDEYQLFTSCERF